MAELHPWTDNFHTIHYHLIDVDGCTKSMIIKLIIDWWYMHPWMFISSIMGKKKFIHHHGCFILVTIQLGFKGCVFSVFVHPLFAVYYINGHSRIALCCFGNIMGCPKGTSSRMEKQQCHSLGYPWYRIFSKNSPPIHACFPTPNN